MNARWYSALMCLESGLRHRSMISGVGTCPSLITPTMASVRLSIADQEIAATVSVLATALRRANLLKFDAMSSYLDLTLDPVD